MPRPPRDKEAEVARTQAFLELTNTLHQAHVTAPPELRRVPYLWWLVIGYVSMLVAALPNGQSSWLHFAVFFWGCFCGLVTMRLARLRQRRKRNLQSV